MRAKPTKFLALMENNFSTTLSVIGDFFACSFDVLDEESISPSCWDKNSISSSAWIKNSNFRSLGS